MDKTEQKIRETARKFQQEKEGALVIDFDEAVKEQKAKAIQVKFGGSTYELPAEPPAWLPLFIEQNSKGGELDDEKNLELISLLLGKEFAGKIVDDKNNFVSFESVNNYILVPVMNRWGLEDVADSSDKKK